MMYSNTLKVRYVNMGKILIDKINRLNEMQNYKKKILLFSTMPYLQEEFAPLLTRFKVPLFAGSNEVTWSILRAIC